MRQAGRQRRGSGAGKARGRQQWRTEPDRQLLLLPALVQLATAASAGPVTGASAHIHVDFGEVPVKPKSQNLPVGRDGGTLVLVLILQLLPVQLLVSEVAWSGHPPAPVVGKGPQKGRVIQT